MNFVAGHVKSTVKRGQIFEITPTPQIISIDKIRNQLLTSASEGSKEKKYA
jgi:hypothetical protein